jgi:arylsulfatase A-like enzyme
MPKPSLHRILATLDALARNGVRYSRAYSETPICIPARRSLMTGASPRRHGDRRFQPALAMPKLPTLAACFRAAGYQAQAIGKLHVYPQRDRIGFDDALLAEEGRGHLGTVDDYELFLADRGLAGRQFLHGLSNNEYGWRPWHLPEDCHVTNWVTFAAARAIKRRDPTRPALWHVSYTHPHPPLAPLASYLERYRGRAIDPPVVGSWAADEAALPYALRLVRSYYEALSPERLADARRAFYALCTHIDHQIRILIGSLAEEQVLDDTIIVVTSDHGDMLGDHGLYAKRYMLDGSVRVPMILVDVAGSARAAPGTVDDRLVGLQDMMPTLLGMCGLPIPPECEGLSMVGARRREVLYCEALEGPKATRMVVSQHHKLIWYPAGNRLQLFDVVADPGETTDLVEVAAHRDARERLTAALRGSLYGDDLAWLRDGRLVGMAPPEFAPVPNRGLSGQRGVHYPPPRLADDPMTVVGTV